MISPDQSHFIINAKPGVLPQRDVVEQKLTGQSVRAIGAFLPRHERFLCFTGGWGWAGVGKKQIGLEDGWRFVAVRRISLGKGACSQ